MANPLYRSIECHPMFPANQQGVESGHTNAFESQVRNLDDYALLLKN